MVNMKIYFKDGLYGKYIFHANGVLEFVPFTLDSADLKAALDDLRKLCDVNRVKREGRY